MPTLPPIIERELRRLAKQPKTFAARVFFAAVPFFFILGAITASNGPSALKTTAAIAGCLAHFAGGLSVARSIVEERRQGTLPILFLTPLTPVEMIGGKLTAHLAVAFSYLLTLVPALTISISVGGVSAGDVFTVACALINSAFCSTAMGMLVGSFAREQGQPVFTAIMIMVILGLATIPVAAYLRANGAGNLAMPLAAILGSLPLFLAFDPAGTQSSALFSSALALSHACAWAMVLMAGRRCLLIARSAGDKPKTSGFLGLSWNAEPSQPRSRLDKNPVEWLLARNPGVARTAWGLFFCIALAITGAFLILPRRRFIELVPAFYFIGYTFKLLAFSAGTDFFLREKKSGGMELMLTSMLTADEIRTGAIVGYARPILAAFACSAVVWLCFMAGSVAISGSTPLPVVVASAVTAVLALDILSVLTTALLSGVEFQNYRKAAAMAWIRGLVAPSVLVIALRADGGIGGAFLGALIGSAIASWWAWQAISRKLDGLRKESLEARFSPAFFDQFIHPTPPPASETPR